MSDNENSSRPWEYRCTDCDHVDNQPRSECLECGSSETCYGWSQDDIDTVMDPYYDGQPAMRSKVLADRIKVALKRTQSEWAGKPSCESCYTYWDILDIDTPCGIEHRCGNCNERAAERALERHYGGGGPSSIQEQAEAAYKQKRELERFDMGAYANQLLANMAKWSR